MLYSEELVQIPVVENPSACNFLHHSTSVSFQMYNSLHFVLQKWHPDKHGDANAATLKFQEINEAYRGQ